MILMGDSNFDEGDVFYTLTEGNYHLFKLLRSDSETETYHVLCYKPVGVLPSKDDLQHLPVKIYHSPIHQNGFGNAELLAKEAVTADDLIGYHEYLRQTQNTSFIITTASTYYRRAHKLTDEKAFEQAIDEYSKAIDLVPNFFEAIDNRAFCKMDLARWEEAIEDFRTSLLVKSDSVLAEFSIGECYLRLGDGHRAKEHFEKALKIDPTDKLSSDFLQKAIALIERG